VEATSARELVEALFAALGIQGHGEITLKLVDGVPGVVRATQYISAATLAEIPVADVPSA